MNQIQIEDYNNIGNLGFINWEQLRNSTILVTGSTGLIGSNLVGAIAYNSQIKELNIRLILPVRNVAAANEQFGWTKAQIIPYQLGSLLEVDKDVNYVVHLASPTSSSFFKNCPSDTLLANIDGVKAILNWAKNHTIRKMVYLSTMEVYGFPEKGHKVKENELGAFETMFARNSYPIAKIASEALCNSYYVQYGVPAVVLRATQTFGPGIRYDDGRVFAEFMRCAIENKNIILKSEGLTERPYLYTADAVSAILVGLIRGVCGQAYTVANPNTYISIINMAKLVANSIANGKIEIVYEKADNIADTGYADTLYMDLDISKILSLGWKPTVDLMEMYKRMIEGMKA